jgi:copper homeostasis protein
MRREIEALVKAGVDGVVIGSLCADGYLNETQMKGMIEAAQGRRITLHRAFDVCADPHAALETAKELGVNIILTSGQEKDCLTGRALIGSLVKEAGDSICIMAGGGVNAAVISRMQRETGLSAFHMSGKETLDSGMIFRNPKVSMGLPGISEFEVWRTSQDAVAKAAEVLKQI